MFTARSVVEWTLAAIGGVSDKNGNYILSASNSHLLSIEGVLYSVPARADAINPDVLALVPKRLRPSPPPKRIRHPPGFPDSSLFDRLRDFLDCEVHDYAGRLADRFDGPFERESRIMRRIGEVRRDINLAVEQICAAERTRIGRPFALTLPSGPHVQTVRVPASRRLPFETVQMIVAHCDFLMDLQNLAHHARLRTTVASTVREVAFARSSDTGVPLRWSEAWAIYNLIPLLQYLRLETPLRNSAAPFLPPWHLLAVIFDMTIAVHWTLEDFVCTLSALGEPVLPLLTLVRPSRDAVEFICHASGFDPVARLRFVQNADGQSFDVALRRVNGRERRLETLDPTLDEVVFDQLTFRAVKKLVLSDKLRTPALEALYALDLSALQSLEIVVDDRSSQWTWGRPEERLLQQHRAYPPRTLHCPNLRRVKLTAVGETVVRVSGIVIESFVAATTGGSVVYKYDNVALM